MLRKCVLQTATFVPKGRHSYQKRLSIVDKEALSSVLQHPFQDGRVVIDLSGDCRSHLDQGIGQGLFREVITGRVEFGFGDSHILDDALLDNHCKSLATSMKSQRVGTIGGKLHAAGFGELTGRIREESDHGSIDSLISCPSIHDSGVIDAVNDNFFDSCFFECVLRFQVSWNLSAGSGRRESTWKTNNGTFLVGGVFGDVVLGIRVAEVVEQLNSRDLASGLDGGKGFDRSGRQSGQ